MATRSGALLALARAHGVQPWFRDAYERRRDVDAEHLAGVLSALGVDAGGPDGAARALRERHLAIWTRTIEPVIVAPAGLPGQVGVRTPAERADDVCELVLEPEGGDPTGEHVSLAGIEPEAKADLPEGSFVAKRFALPPLPVGYHRVRVRVAGDEREALVIAPPARMPPAPRDTWGVFAPLYALRTARARPVADLIDLGELLDAVASRGGGVVATLPLLTTFLDEPFEPSPYSPVSRLFWNELYADLGEDSSAPPDDLVDHRGAWAERRRALAARARDWREGPAVLDGDAELAAYARFRAATERHGPFEGWERGAVPDADDEAVLAYAYGQTLAREQIAALGARDATLLFDLPLGVHRQGYDAWRYGEVFATEASAGAPADSFFTGGQDWTFAPLHPEHVRETGYAYPIACVRHLLRHARILRIDHVMGLHRLWWIPPGAAPAEGAYVRYRPEEWYALLGVEAARAGAAIVGEDLGTVPSEVRRAMARHGVHRTYVVQEELDEDAGLRPVRADAVAGLNTHDMPPFAMFWEGLDIQRRIDLGLLDATTAEAERARRDRLRAALVADLRDRGMLADDGDDAPAVLRGCLRALGASRAPVVVVALEDLWGETEPQNTPGVAGGTSWRRRMRHSLEEAFALTDARDALAVLDHARKEEIA